MNTKPPKGRLRKGKKAHCRLLTHQPKYYGDGSFLFMLVRASPRQIKLANRFKKLQQEIFDYYEYHLCDGCEVLR
jgi:hypothetical protein